MNKNEFIFTEKPKEEAYNHWLAKIERIERFTMESSHPGDSIDIGFFLFPAINSISSNLGYSLRGYLRELGLSKRDAHLICEIFRNGLLHNYGNHRLVFDDEESITWGMFSSGGSGGFRAYNPGYTSDEYPEDNLPPDRIFVYEEIDKEGEHVMATLYLDRLAALVRYDLEQRRVSDQRTTIPLIVGKRVKGKRPTADPRPLEED